MLAVIPIQKEQRERAHDKEEKDPDSEASIVFDCLVRHKHQKLDFLSYQPKPNADILSCISYLSYILIAIFDVLRCTHNQLVNIVNLAFLSQEMNTFMSKRFNLKTVFKRQDGRRVELTCCKTFSANISWSREISTTFPSICLVSVKIKTQTFFQRCLYFKVHTTYSLNSFEEQILPHFIHQAVHFTDQPLVFLFKLHKSTL